VASQYVLDAYALLALLTDEAGSEQVTAVLENLDSSVYISALNVGEVYYIWRRRRGVAAARDAEKAIFAQPNLNVVVPSWRQIRDAAELKSEGGLSFVDAFAAALANQLSAPLLTGDSEFAELERQGIIQILWLRPSNAR